MSYRKITREYYEYRSEFAKPRPIFTQRIDSSMDARIYNFNILGVYSFFLVTDYDVFIGKSLSDISKCLLKEYGVSRALGMPEVKGFNYSILNETGCGGGKALNGEGFDSKLFYNKIYQPISTRKFAALSIANPQ